MGGYHILVVGGGVVGLTTALKLQRSLRTSNITLVADRLTVDTTSDGAAGIFNPSEQFKGPTPDIAKEWIDYSFYYYKDLLDEPNAGVKEISGYFYSDRSRKATKNHFLVSLLPEYRDVEDDELSASCPLRWKFGSFCRTLLIECRYYLPWAMKRFESLGGKIIQGSLETFSDVKKFGNFDLVINCTGLGARELCNDIHLLPIRGQVFKVEAPWLNHFYYGESDTYIVPGISAATLGGSRHYNSFGQTWCPHDGAAIWERCTQLVPRLSECRVVRQWVGLRPHRDVVRVQPEVINGIKVVHNYGHGGYGVTSAPGTARTAVQITVDLLKSTAKL